MFGGKRNTSRRPIGVAVTPEGVRLAQAGPPGEGTPLTATGFAPFDGQDACSAGYDQRLGEAIECALKQARFVGKRCVSAMPAESMQYKNVRLPKMPEPELASAVAWEAKERVMLGEPASVQFYHAGAVQQGQDERSEVVLVAAKQSAVDAHVRGLSKAGLVPVAIDATGAALARVAASTGDTSFIVFAHRTMAEVVVARQSRVLLNKLLPLEEGGIAATPPQELAREIGLCLRYHTVTFRGEKPDRILLAGDVAPAPLMEAIQSALGLPAVPLHEAVALGTPTADESADTWAIAAGLSLRSPAESAKRGAA